MQNNSLYNRNQTNSKQDDIDSMSFFERPFVKNEQELKEKQRKAKRKLKILLALISTIVVVFLGFNIYLYSITYRDYVTKAPESLKEARKDFTKAYIPHVYYIFFIKAGHIDFKSKSLDWIRDWRDYYYHRGLQKLPQEEAERALWFDLFEALPYNFSCRGSYGGMTRRYGEAFAKDFIDKVYDNIKILATYKLTDYTPQVLGASALQSYLNLVDIYIADFSMIKDGLLFSENNLHKISTDKEINERLVNIYNWRELVLDNFKLNHKEQYNKALNPNIGWYSWYIRDKDDILIASSFVLFYKIANNQFDCANDRKYFDSIENAKFAIEEYSQTHSRNHITYSILQRTIKDLAITNNLDRNQTIKSTNPLKLSIECKY
jgi:hypothetical protein